LRKGAHPQHVNVVTIRKIASVEDDSVETDVHSAIGCMDATDRHKVFEDRWFE
jgi:hypothetical protein